MSFGIDWGFPKEFSAIPSIGYLGIYKNGSVEKILGSFFTAVVFLGRGKAVLETTTISS